MFKKGEIIVSKENDIVMKKHFNLLIKLIDYIDINTDESVSYDFFKSQLNEIEKWELSIIFKEMNSFYNNFIDAIDDGNVLDDKKAKEISINVHFKSGGNKEMNLYKLEIFIDALEELLEEKNEKVKVLKN
ncbi:MAG: hypothetical protein ACRCUM_03890 [Mycoplasmoidaceae bacterium]